MLQFITDNATDTQATLAANPMFAGLDQAERAAFELGSGSVRLAAGEILFRQGDPGDALYLIVSGRLGVRVANADGIETIVDDLRPPASVGELALLTEQVRGATVFALEDAELARVTREDVRRLAQRRPQLIAALTWAVLPRLRQAQLADVLANLFGELDATSLRSLQAALEWQHLAAGEVLFRSNDPGDALYIVINGRLSVTVTDAHGGTTVVGEASRGETVGEVGLLTGSPRSATVTAVRDTDVVRLSQATFERLHARYPRVMVQLSRIIARRTQQLVRSARPTTARAATFAVLPISPSAPHARFVERLVAALAAHGPTIQLDRRPDGRRIGRLVGPAGGRTSLRCLRGRLALVVVDAALPPAGRPDRAAGRCVRPAGDRRRRGVALAQWGARACGSGADAARRLCAAIRHHGLAGAAARPCAPSPADAQRPGLAPPGATVDWAGHRAGVERWRRTRPCACRGDSCAG